MSEEHIDPREVRVIEEKINPDEVKVYGGGFFGPKRSDWNRMRAMFSGEDPYAAAASPENRQQLEASVNLMPDPDAELRKIAVTAYMSRMKRENVSFVYDNLDKILETYYGQKTSVDEAFKDIGGMLLNGRGDDGSGTGNEIFLAVGSGLAGAADFALSIGKFLARYAVPHDVTKENPFENLLKRAKEPVSDYRATLSGGAKTKTIAEAWKAGETGANLVKLIAEEGPALALQLGTVFLTGGSGPFLMGGVFTEDKREQLLKENPEMSLGQMGANLAMTYIINTIDSAIDMKVLKGASAPVRKEITESIFYALKHIFKPVLIEGGTEGLQRMAENGADYITGVYDKEIAAGAKVSDLLVRGVPEEALLGAISGAGMSALGFRAVRDVDRMNNVLLSTVDTEIEELRNKETPSDEDISNLHKLEELRDAGNAEGMRSVLIQRAIREYNRSRPKAEEAARREAEMTVDDRAEQYKESYRLRNEELRHNPEETQEAVVEVSRFYPGYQFEVYDGAENMPPAARREALRLGYSPRGIDAFILGNTCYVNMGRLRPSDVPKRVLEEVAGHRGLRAVFGDQYDSMLDGVYRDFFREEEFQKIAKRYFRLDQLDTVENQRYVTEEFLAHNARMTPELKPSWWKEFLQKIKMALRKLPGFQNLRFTDRELERILMRGIAAVRDNRAYQNSADGDVRFAAVLRREGAPNTADRPGQLRDSHVPHRIGFMEEYGFGGKGLYADYEFLFGRHPEYFEDAEHARAAVEFVLDDPEATTPLAGNAAFIRKDESTGISYRIEIEKKSRAKYNHIRSVHKLSDLQYEKAKAGAAPANAASPVLQPSQNRVRQIGEDLTGRNGRTVSDFLRYDSTENGKVKFSVSPVYTGSAADYDSPSLQYIGTGEGAQVYGWGLYGSSSEKVARWYARTDAERKNRARILLDGKEFDPEQQDKADHSGEPTEFEIANSVLDDVLGRKGSISGTLEYYRLQMGKTETIRDNPEFYRLCREWLEKNRDRIQYIPENEDLSGKRNLYRQTFFPGKEENLLDWDKPVPEDQRRKIEEQLKEEGFYVEGNPDEASAEYRELKKRKNAGEGVSDEELDEAYTRAERLHAQRNVTGTTINGDIPSGSMVYENLEDIVGEPKAVSEFLFRAGIDGVTYIGGSSGVRNYVAFSDQDIRVDEHIRFSIIGESGAGRSLESERLLRNLSAAREMERRGEYDAGYIKFVTGWERGKDGKWRTENSDDWRFRPEVLNREFDEILTVGDAIDAPELFSYYPELRDHSLAFLPAREMKGATGYFDRAGEEIAVSEDLPPDEIRSTLIHEIQHWIQEKEGFARGGNLSDAADRSGAEQGDAERFSVYRRFAGEVEARNAERRAELPLEQRLVRLLKETEDVAEEDKIYLERGVKDGNRTDEADGGTLAEIEKHKISFSVNKNFDAELEKQRNGSLKAGHIYQLGMPPQVLLNTGIPNLPIELSASRLAEKAGAAHHPFEIEKLKGLPLALKDPVGVFAYGNKEKAQNIVIELQKNGKHFIVGLSLKFEHDGLMVNSIRGLYPKDTHEWLNWIQQGKALYLNKEKIQRVIAQQRRNPADVSYLDLDSVEKIVQDFQNVKSEEGEKSEKVQFSLNQYSDADWRDMVGYMKAKVGTLLTKPDADYRRILEEAGMECFSDADAHAIAAEAMEENRKDAHAAGRRLRDKWIYENELTLRQVIDFTGSDDFKLVPDQDGKKFTGTWIAPEYVKYSEKRPQGETESDRSYKRYLNRREKKLKSAKGYRIDEVAKAIARKTGGDPETIQKQLVDYFRDLKKPDLYHKYAEFRKQSELSNRELRNNLREEWEELQYSRAEEAVIELLENGREITRGWIRVNRLAYQILYKQVFGKEAPRNPGKKDFEDLNAALRQKKGDMATFAAGLKEGRRILSEEYLKKLSDFKAKVCNDWNDIRELQYEAKKFAYEHVEKGFRERFISGIIGLSKYTSKISIAYPEGRRRHEFDRLCEEMKEYQRGLLKDKALRGIQDLLKRNRAKRTDKNVAFSPMGERQRALDRINQIVRMNPETAAGCMEYALERKARAEEQKERLGDPDEESSPERDAAVLESAQAEREIFYLNHFGGLKLKEPEFVQKSYQLLKDFVKAGRFEYQKQIEQRREELERKRADAIREMAAGNEEVPSGRDLDRSVNPVENYVFQNESITRLFDVLSRTPDWIALDKGHAGRMIRLIEDSTRREEERLDRMQKWFDTTLKESCGVQGLVSKGRFLNGAMKEETVTVDGNPVKLIQYGTLLGEKDNQVAHWDMGRPRRRAWMHVEHCRKMLEDLNSGMDIRSYLKIDDLETSKDVRSGLHELKIETGRFYSVCRTGNGFRIYTEGKDGFTTGTDLKKEDAPPALTVLLKDEKNLLPVSDIMRYGAEQQLLEYDAGADERIYKGLGDEVDESAWRAFQDGEGRERRIELMSPGENVVKKEEALKLSPGAAMELILLWEQDHYRPGMEWNGYTEEVIGQLKKWLDSKNPGYLKFAYAMRDFLVDERAELDEAVFKRYGVHLPEMKNFFYGDFSGSVGTRIPDPGFGNPSGGMTVNATFLTARRFHLVAPDTHSNAISLFMRKQLEQNHFICWTETLRELRGIYGNRSVQNVMVKEFGQAMWNNLREKIENLASNGSAPDKAAKYLAHFYKSWAPGNVAINTSSIIKQIAGGSSYGLYVPTHKLLQYLPEANHLNRDYRTWLKDPRVVRFVANRMSGGMDPNLAGLLNYARRGGSVSTLNETGVKKLLSPQLYTDRLAVTTFGYAAYRHFYEQGRKKGMTLGEAEEYAIRMWQRATDETQQSGALKDLNHFTSNPGVWRYLTTFMTNPMQTAALELTAWQKFLKDRNRKNFGSLVNRIIVNHMVNTTLMNLVGSALRHGLNIGDYLEDWDDYVAGWLLGSFDALWLFGKGAAMFIGGLTGDRYASDMSAVPLLSDLARDGRTMVKIANGEEVDILDWMKISGDVLMSAGPGKTRLAGILMYALAREGKRWKKLIGGE